MKRKHSRLNVPTGRAPKPAPAGQRVSARLWRHRLAAMVLIPVLFFAVVEGLRLAGYGYSTGRVEPPTR